MMLIEVKIKRAMERGNEGREGDVTVRERYGRESTGRGGKGEQVKRWGRNGGMALNGRRRRRYEV